MQHGAEVQLLDNLLEPGLPIVAGEAADIGDEVQETGRRHLHVTRRAFR